MKNAAGDDKCDDYLRLELEAANIPYEEMKVLRKINGEVPSAILGILDGWIFRRAWRYWVAEAKNTLLLFQYADELHKTHGQDVRVSGHCACPAPREWHHQPWCLGVSFYHVDTQDGLTQLASAIRKQTSDNKTGQKIIE